MTSSLFADALLVPGLICIRLCHSTPSYIPQLASALQHVPDKRVHILCDSSKQKLSVLTELKQLNAVCDVLLADDRWHESVNLVVDPRWTSKKKVPVQVNQSSSISFVGIGVFDEVETQTITDLLKIDSPSPLTHAEMSQEHQKV